MLRPPRRSPIRSRLRGSSSPCTSCPLPRETWTKAPTVRAAGRAARCAGARRKPRREPPGKVDPALAERVRIACERATGFRPRFTATRVEIPIADEHELAELAETLERSSPETLT